MKKSTASNEFDEDEEEESRISTLAQNEDEMRGLLRLAVFGAGRLAQGGNFDPPPSCVEAKHRFMDSASPIRSWAKECTELSLGTTTSGEILWQSFTNYCTVNGYKRERDEDRNTFYDYLATFDLVTPRWQQVRRTRARRPVGGRLMLKGETMSEQRRAKISAAMAPYRKPLVHGTANGYKNKGCRCADCRAASTLYMSKEAKAARRGAALLRQTN